LLQAPSTTQPKKIFEKTAILIVDDEPDILSVLKKSLEDDGYEVYGFTHPVAALEHLKDNPEYYSVLISDIRMPGMSGFELARTVRSLNSKIKIILMTAFEVNMSEFVQDRCSATQAFQNYTRARSIGKDDPRANQPWLILH
jgi:CheY-like chemotaxis protein